MNSCECLADLEDGQDRLDSGLGVLCREQLCADAAVVAQLFQLLDDVRVIQLARARLMTTRNVSDVEMSDGIQILRDGVADAALVDLHVIDIIQNAEVRGTDQTDNLSSHLRALEEVADVIDMNVQNLEVELNLVLLCELGSLNQRAVHGAQLDGVGQIVVVVGNDAALTQCIGMDGQAERADLLCSSDRLLEELQIVLHIVRINQRKSAVLVAVEACDDNSSLFSRFLDCIQITVRPAPELNGLKSIVLRGLETIQERDFRIQTVDVYTLFDSHFDLLQLF